MFFNSLGRHSKHKAIYQHFVNINGHFDVLTAPHGVSHLLRNSYIKNAGTSVAKLSFSLNVDNSQLHLQRSTYRSF